MSASGTNRTTSDVRISVANVGKPGIAQMAQSVAIDPKRTFKVHSEIDRTRRC